MPYIVKIVLTVILVVAITEVSKKNTVLGGLIASLPLISLLSIIWLFFETRDIQKISNFSYGVFWYVVPSLSLFVSLPLFLKKNIPFPIAIIMACVVCVICYYIMSVILKRNGINM
jgi:hypothetical protein